MKGMAAQKRQSPDPERNNQRGSKPSAISEWCRLTWILRLAAAAAAWPGRAGKDPEWWGGRYQGRDRHDQDLQQRWNVPNRDALSLLVECPMYEAGKDLRRRGRLEIGRLSRSPRLAIFRKHLFL
jgi:hypothetical protein